MKCIYQEGMSILPLVSLGNSRLGLHLGLSLELFYCRFRLYSTSCPQIVFAAITFVFVLVGHIIFGAHIRYFNSSAGTLEMAYFQMLGFMVDPIRDKMIEKGGFLGLLWFFLFTVIVAILLVNMVLAIIFDIYAEVKSELGDSHSIFEQVLDL